MPIRTATPVLRRVGGVRHRTFEDMKRSRFDSEPYQTALLEKILEGKLNCTGEMTLDVSPATSTVFTDPRITALSVVLMMAYTASAAALQAGATGIRIVPADGLFTVHHAADAATDLTFRFAVFG